MAAPMPLPPPVTQATRPPSPKRLSTNPGRNLEVGCTGGGWLRDAHVRSSVVGGTSLSPVASAALTPATTSATCGSTSRSSTAANGIGVSFAVTRTGRASSRSQAASVTRATTSLAKPPARAPSLDDDEPARLLERGNDRVEVERLQRPEIDHLDLDALAGEPASGLQRELNPARVGDHRHIGAHALHVGDADRQRVLLLRDGPETAVVQAPLEEDNGVVVANRRLEEPLRVVGRRGHHDDEPGRVHEPRFEGLRVLRGHADPARDGGSEHERNADLSARHVPPLRRMVRDLIHHEGDEVGDLQLDDGPAADERGADARHRPAPPRRSARRSRAPAHIGRAGRP